MAEIRGRILNVDDYVPARYARSEVLRRAGYEVVEADTGAEALRIVAEERPDLVMLDNMSPEDVAKCVAVVERRAVVEVSGGVTLETIGAFAATGVDQISVGRITNSAAVLDIGLDVS